MVRPRLTALEVLARRLEDEGEATHVLLFDLAVLELDVEANTDAARFRERCARARDAHADAACGCDRRLRRKYHDAVAVDPPDRCEESRSGLGADLVGFAGADEQCEVARCGAVVEVA